MGSSGAIQGRLGPVWPGSAWSSSAWLGLAQLGSAIAPPRLDATGVLQKCIIHYKNNGFCTKEQGCTAGQKLLSMVGSGGLSGFFRHGPASPCLAPLRPAQLGKIFGILGLFYGGSAKRFRTPTYYIYIYIYMYIHTHSLYSKFGKICLPSAFMHTGAPEVLSHGM